MHLTSPANRLVELANEFDIKSLPQDVPVRSLTEPERVRVATFIVCGSIASGVEVQEADVTDHTVSSLRALLAA